MNYPTSSVEYEAEEGDDTEYWKLRYERLLSQYIKQEKELHICKSQNKLYQEMNDSYPDHFAG